MINNTIFWIKELECNNFKGLKDNSTQAYLEPEN